MTRNYRFFIDLKRAFYVRISFMTAIFLAGLRLRERSWISDKVGIYIFQI